jgi:hypothetical protein
MNKIACCVALLLSASAYAQKSPVNVVTSSVPFLRIAPDARSGGMGQVGIATSADASAGYWNMGKVVFNEAPAGVAASYIPWLKDLVNDMYLGSVSGYYKLDDNQALSASVRYFNLGSVQFTDASGNMLQSYRPNEFGIDAGYSRKLSDKIGLGLSLRYIHSSLAKGASGLSNYKAGNAVAADLGFYYNNKDEAGEGFSYGAALSNLGSRIAYTSNADQKSFIPANLGLGIAYNKNLDDNNKLSFGLDVNKLLVPTPPADTSAGAIANYYKKSVVGSWFSSFGDSRGGAKEELKEFQVSIGAEYWYSSLFSLRGGYNWEAKDKGDRRFFTVGAGLRYNMMNVDISYLIATGTSTTRNPLANTLRFSLLINLESKE